MRFDVLHRRVSYALVTVALLLLAMSGELSPLVWGFAFAALLPAFPRWMRPRRSKVATRLWNAGLVVVLLIILVAALATGNWLVHMVHFGIVMTVAKLYGIARARDILQLYALSFLLVVGGAVVNPGLSFAGLFLVFVVLLTWALILLHLRRDMEMQAAQESALARGERTANKNLEATHEEAVEAIDWRADTLISRRFLAGTSVLAVVLFVLSLSIFLVFPRLGLGFFTAKTRNKQSVSGFGSDIELGHFGTIRDNMAVVMRVELPDEPPSPTRTLRLRGISFDTYDGNRWRKSDKGGEILATGRRGFHDAAPELGPISFESLLRQDIYLEPINTGRPVLFGAPLLRYVQRPSDKLKDLAERASAGMTRLRFLRDKSGDVSFQGGDRSSAFAYTVYSDTRSLWPPNGGLGEIPDAIEKRYLQIPDDMDPRIAALAKYLTQDADRPAAKAQALETRLQTDWGYTLEGGHDPRDPLADFLFERKEGHCEYFSTAMTLMARSLGLPARAVNGFYGGEWNDYGAYHAIRQADAHSWVEIWFPGLGWKTYDPTPAQERAVQARSGILADIQAWFDALQMQWYKWVIEYDLSKQIEFFRGVASVFTSSDSPFGDVGKNLNTKALKEFFRDNALSAPVLATLGFLVLLFVIRWVRRRSRRPNKEKKEPRPQKILEALRLWDRVEVRLAKLGFPRRPEQSPRRWTEHLAAEGHPKADELSEGATALYEVVWGGRLLDETRKDALARAAEAAKE